MKKIKQNILLAIVIAGLLISTTASITALNIETEKADNSFGITKVEKETLSASNKMKEMDYDLNQIYRPLANSEFDYEGDQIHPAFGKAEPGYMAAYFDVVSGQILWTNSPETGVYFDIGGDYPSIKNWDGNRFFATLVPDWDDSHGGIVYLFETTDPSDPEGTYSLVGWDWSDLPDFPGEILWHDIIDIEMACNPSKETWEWGFVSMVSDTNYGDDPLEKAPFISYQTSEDGYATISWYLIEGCEHTDNVIDPVTLEAYSVYDIYDSEETAPYYGLFIRMDYYDDWDKDGVAYIYTADGDLKYPAVTSNDGNILIVTQSNEDGDNDITCFYGTSLDNLQTSYVAETGDDEMYPDIRHMDGNKFICTYVKNGNLYGKMTENAGITWSEEWQINDNSGAVEEEYKTSDLCKGGSLVMWEELSTDLDIWYGSALDNDAPVIPTINGPSKGGVGKEQEFEVSSTDPDGDDVYYYIDWGDGKVLDWDGPYNSGDKITKKHTFNEETDYTIKVKAKDVYDLESDWAQLVFSAPKTKMKLVLLFEDILNRFPLLKQLLGI